MGYINKSNIYIFFNCGKKRKSYRLKLDLNNLGKLGSRAGTENLEPAENRPMQNKSAFISGLFKCLFSFKNQKENQQHPNPMDNLGKDEFLVYILFVRGKGQVPGPYCPPELPISGSITLKKPPADQPKAAAEV